MFILVLTLAVHALFVYIINGVLAAFGIVSNWIMRTTNSFNNNIHMCVSITKKNIKETNESTYTLLALRVRVENPYNNILCHKSISYWSFDKRHQKEYNVFSAPITNITVISISIRLLREIDKNSKIIGFILLKFRNGNIS